MTVPTRDEVKAMAREAGTPEPMVFSAAYERLVAAAYARGAASESNRADALAATIAELRDLVTTEGETKADFVARVRAVLGEDPDARVVRAADAAYARGAATEREARQAAQTQVAELQERLNRADAEKCAAVLAEREVCSRAKAGKPRKLKPFGTGMFLDDQQCCFDQGWREGAASVRAAIRARNGT